MIRLFFAVTLPAELLAACEHERVRVQRVLGPAATRVRFTRPEGLHVTLKFLGWTPEVTLAAIQSEAARAAAACAPFALALRGIEAFPNARRPRVVYFGISEGTAPMQALARKVEEHVAPLGFPTEERTFVPHVTLLRVREPRSALSVGDRLAKLVGEEEIGRFEVTKLSLMQSELLPAGARYTELSGFPLAG